MIDVARLRKSLGLSQAAFAERLRVNQSTISRLETGDEPSGPLLILLQKLEEERLQRKDDATPDSNDGAPTERAEAAQ